MFETPSSLSRGLRVVSAATFAFAFVVLETRDYVFTEYGKR
jgi:hypothetical protein